jgi:hypothetical protein
MYVLLPSMLNRMNKTCLCAVLLIQSTFALAKERTELLGKWEFHYSSKDFPAQCRNAQLNFTSISTLETYDGYRKTLIEYSAETIPSGEGFNLITQKVSSDGKLNCRGEAASGYKNEPLVFFLVNIAPDGSALKLYFSNDYYHIYQRVR